MRRIGLLLATGLLATGCTTSTAVQLRSGDPAAQPGGVLRVALTAPGSVDPGNVYEPVGELIARTLCTPLFGTDPKTSALLPGIASSYLVSDGGATISLRLRDDVVFSDGTPLTSKDVAFTLSRVASADYASTSAQRLAPIDGYAQIHADVPTNDDVERRQLRGVSVRDDHNIQIQLTQPLSDFVRVLSSPLLSPVSEQAAEADPAAFARQPVCVGPYQLQKPYTPGDDGLRLVRSSAYTPVDTARTRGGTSYADSIDIRVYNNMGAAAAAVVAGQADVAPARPTDTAGVQVGAGPAVEYLGLPTSAPAFKEPRIRQAVALAIDREELVRRVFPGTRVPAHGFLPQTSQADDRCALLPAGGDVAQAKTLLAQAG
ncbi:MAG: ABC transporter substrate-binding protein, partial [Frankiales bacterium]|nr:ABC transporter substrate-binding protein [Frankiales bacterium]